MVKSRRAASSSWLPNTLSRRMRPCSSVSWSSEAGARKVEVSMISWPNTTCTSWKRRPMMRARRNSGRICSGVALVATSKSLGSRPTIRSRTAPPTI
ncbi:Uncharacterised protein [Bordetella pertussis]|nr:Uncharacterised protein [Bordetella pertussis]CFP59870.1 Uncharacterised protein [Bordetella pertussis]